MGFPITIRMLNTSRESGLPAKQIMHLTFNRQCISLAELIEKRVLTEIEAYEKDAGQHTPLIELDDKELLLNASPSNASGPLDSKKAIAKALKSFRRSAFFVIVNGKQITELDHILELDDETEVEFFPLFPLMGG